MKKTKALRLAEKFYRDSLSKFDYIPMLCVKLPSDLVVDFRKYWKKLDSKKLLLIGLYLKRENRDEDHIELLRLLVLHQFINETYKD